MVSEMRILQEKFSEIRKREDDKCELTGILEQMQALEKKYSCFGENDVSMFYEKYKKYEILKSKQGLICTVCGVRDFTGESCDDLQDAILFKHLLRVDIDMVKLYKSMKHNKEDEIGALAQKCFHIV